jgi:hypothetical protein
MLAKRARVAELYRNAQADIDGLLLPCPDADGAVRGWLVFVVQPAAGYRAERHDRRAREQARK